jgi:hypothetical protein
MRSQVLEYEVKQALELKTDMVSVQAVVKGVVVQ